MVDIYMAGPLFTRGERSFNSNLAFSLRVEYGYSVYNPQEHEDMFHHNPDLSEAVHQHIDKVKESRVLMINMDGDDGGSNFEAGLAFAHEIPILYYWTDKRYMLDELDVNLMIAKNRRSINLMEWIDHRLMIPTGAEIAGEAHRQIQKMERNGEL